MKKITWLLGILFLAVAVTGCGREPQMDQLDKGAYHYKNAAYNFQVDLPQEFIYYQVQSKIGKDEKGVASTDWQDVEFYVPMNDRTYEQEVPGYAKVFTVRVFNSGNYHEQKGFEKLIDAQGKVYAIRFWDKLPKDWQPKWKPELAEKIKKSLQVIK
jgi:hypothetical protein